uniref:Uncharacterized protein n=1 Tax=Plectus sambesii TaxID=2011161 RepID=A0A914W5L7_9BILA
MSASGSSGAQQAAAGGLSARASKLTDRLYRIRSNTDSELHVQHHPQDEADVATAFPQFHRSRLYQLFAEIEKEFEALFAENLALHAKVEALTERIADGGALPPEATAEILAIAAADVSSKHTSKRGIQMGQKLKTALRVPPGRLVSTFKVGNDTSRSHFVRTFDGHGDGVWHVSTSNGSRPVLGSSSADQTARIWSLETGACLLQYVGHSGSVNSVSFSPTSTDAADLMVVTASGDQSAHVWKASVSLPSAISHQPLPSSEDELEPMSEKEDVEGSAWLPRANRRCHRRMVCCAAWADDHPATNLITSGFDKQIIGWKVAATTVSKD